MKILLLGANGYLGARLFYDLRNGFEVTGTYHREQFYKDFVHVDLTNSVELTDIIHTYQPEIIIHNANHPSPRPAEKDPEGYKTINLFSTKLVRDAAEDVGASLFFISSFAALNPDTIYGEYKLKSEEIVKETASGYFIIRPSLIMGYSPNTANDRPFNRILKCLDSLDIGEFDTSWHCQPTYAGHITDVIISAIEQKLTNKLIHVFCPSVQTQYSIAKDILEPFGIRVNAVDKKIATPLIEQDESQLKDLGLPLCSYDEMLKEIHEEIKNKERFTL